MIGWIAGMLLARNPALTSAHARRLAKAGLVFGIIVAAIAGFALWLHLHDRNVIARERLERKAAEARTALEARDRADTAGTTRDASRAADHDTTADELETIHAEDPAAAHAPASRGTRAVARRLPTH